MSKIVSSIFGGSGDKKAQRAQARAAEQQAAISAEQLAFSKEQWVAEQARRDREEAFLRELSARQRAIEDETLGWAREDRSRYFEHFAPAEEELARQALHFNTGQFGEELAAMLGADIAAQSQAQRIAAIDEMLSLGANPSSGDVMEMARLSRLQTGADTAGAMTGARRAVRDEGFSRLATATQVGRGLPAQYTSAVDASFRASQQPYENMVTSTQLGRGAIDQFMRGLSSASDGYGSSAITWGRYADTANNAWRNFADAAGAFGKFAGMKWGGKNG